MRRLQTQFFVSYEIFGCIGPLLPVYLTEVKGFTETELGYNQAMTSIATMLSPILRNVWPILASPKPSR